MYFKATVSVWRDKRDSSKRINSLDMSKTGEREFILNPKRIAKLQANGTGSKFFYCDNAAGRRESLSYLEVDESVAQIESAINTPFTSKLYTFSVHKNNKPANDTEDLVIQADSLVYIDRYNAIPQTKCWVVYMESSFKRKEVLCSLNFEEMLGYTGTMTFDNPLITWDSITVTFDQT